MKITPELRAVINGKFSNWRYHTDEEITQAFETVCRDHPDLALAKSNHDALQEKLKQVRLVFEGYGFEVYEQGDVSIRHTETVEKYAPLPRLMTASTVFQILAQKTPAEGREWLKEHGIDWS